MPSRDLLRLGQNFLLSLGGEGVQSGFHFVLNLLMIRLLTAYDFGVFAIVFVLGGISLTYGNALISVPATVQMPRQKSEMIVDYLDVAFGTIALLISAAIGMVVAVGLWLTIGSGAEALASGAFVGLWTLRNHVRTVMCARNDMAAATLSHLSYAASAIILMGGVLLFGHALDVTAALAALALGNIIGICVSLRLTGRRIRIAFRRGVWRRYRNIRHDVAWSLFGTTTWNIQGQGLMFLVAFMVGPAAYAPLAAGILLFNPLRPAVAAFVNVFRPDFVHALVEGRSRHLTMVFYAVCGAVVLGCAAIAAVIWAAWPYLDAHIFGEKFSDARMPLVLTFAGLGAVIYLTSAIPLTLVQAAGAFKAVAAATTLGSLVGLVCVSISLVNLPVAWALLGSAAGELACGLYLAVAAVRILRQSRLSASRSVVPLATRTELTA